MKILNSLKRILFKVAYSLPHGMKAGEIINTSVSSSNQSSLEQQIENKRLSVDLIRGEVTQQVEELRYRDYKVSEESRNYKYVGDGQAIKIDSKKEFNGKIKFTQNNKFIVNDILSELNRVDSKDNSKENYTLTIIYGSFRCFLLERYCTKFDVNINENCNELTLHFDSLPNSNIQSSKQFINELEATLNKNKRGEVLDDIVSVTFVTIGVENEKNYVSYRFNNLKLKDFYRSSDEYIMNYVADFYEREDLIDKFKVSELEKKYEEKQRKEVQFSVHKEVKTKKCTNCGELISDEDYNLSGGELGVGLCPKCWLEKLESKKLEENLRKL